MMVIVYDPETRRDLARELADAFLVGRWDAVEVAERGAGCLDRWPSWMTVLGMHVVAVYRSAPAEQPDGLVDLIESFRVFSPSGGEGSPGMAA